MNFSPYFVRTVLVLLALIIALYAAQVYACSAYLDREFVDGTNRICVYNHLGSDYYYTIPSIKTCPLSVTVPH